MAPTAALGEFEQLVLLALLQIGEQAHAVPIHREIARRTGRDVSLGAIYKTLDRLDSKGLVSSAIGDPTPERGGRRKKVYRVEPRGMRALRASVKGLRQMLHGLEPLLEP
jgi:PadR family transcriptional regulator, regulatory protein PadR